MSRSEKERGRDGAKSTKWRGVIGELSENDESSLHLRGCNNDWFVIGNDSGVDLNTMAAKGRAEVSWSRASPWRDEWGRGWNDGMSKETSQNFHGGR